MDRLRSTELRLHALFLQGLEGDAHAYRQFLQATATHLRAFLRSRLQRWPDDVEDLVQESLLAIHNQRLSYDTGVPLTAWVYAIARYKLVDWWRRHARRDSLHDPLDDLPDGELAMFSTADADAGEARRDLAVLLATLPEKQREAIVHTKLDGLSVREAVRRCRCARSRARPSSSRVSLKSSTASKCSTRSAIAGRHQFGEVFAARWQVRIKFIWLVSDVGLHFAVEIGQRLFQRLDADQAPRAGHIRNDIDLHVDLLALAASLLLLPMRLSLPASRLLMFLLWRYSSKALMMAMANSFSSMP